MRRRRTQRFRRSQRRAQRVAVRWWLEQRGWHQASRADQVVSGAVALCIAGAGGAGSDDISIPTGERTGQGSSQIDACLEARPKAASGPKSERPASGSLRGVGACVSRGTYRSDRRPAQNWETERNLPFSLCRVLIVRWSWTG